MQFKHAPAAVSAVFDDPNLVSAAGLVPMLRLARSAGLDELTQSRLRVPTDKGANAGAKVMALVAGMLAGADSIDDMNLLRHGGMRSLFGSVYAPSTLGSFLRAFTFGHVRQLDAVAARVLAGLATRAPIIPASAGAGFVFVDIDDTVIEVHSARKQGAGIGYSRVRGLNAAVVTASTASSAPVILAQRLRRGQVNSPRGADRLLSDALTLLRRTGTAGPVLMRADSAYYGHPTISRALAAGADVSVTVKRNPAVTAAIATIAENDWTPIHYPNAIFDPDTDEMVSDAEVAETRFTAFAKHGGITGRLIVRRVKAHRPRPDQDPLFDTFRYHAFFTTVTADRLNTIAADRAHRAHAIIEHVHADLKNGPLAHLPSGRFAANSAWLVLATIAFNLTRAAGLIADHAGRLATATTATIRRTLISVPARLARSARRITLHLPEAWPWQSAFDRLFITTHAPPPSAAS
ncbi:IS1380 family transposase [Microbacterium sp. KUDC0406]|uniref:IS1380 family transposase n=1 Tax=Microbacterium sp. KUDC0406 TaxID=2909588 RepID=UPI001F1C4DE8|nr:IS1380 family transposase [Microbacterium sp. KUDC0406]UJP09660.1 IS1380 family transposase [Microbacterium sp. KUDC0406]